MRIKVLSAKVLRPRGLVLVASAGAILAASALPAAAQVQDFFCSTFTIGCPEPPPPAPIPVQAPEPAPPPVKHKKKVKKKVVASKTAEPKADDAAAPK